MLVSLAKACKNSIKNNVTGKKILNPIGGYHIENLLNIDTINSSNIYNILTNSTNYINSKKSICIQAVRKMHIYKISVSLLFFF